MRVRARWVPPVKPIADELAEAPTVDRQTVQKLADLSEAPGRRNRPTQPVEIEEADDEGSFW